MFCYDHLLSLFAHNDFVLRLLKLFHADSTFVLPRSKQRRFVHQIRQIGTGKTWRASSDKRRLNIGAQRHLAHMHFQDLLATANVWQTNHHLPVKSTGTQQGSVENIRTVGGGNHNHTLITVKAIHFYQQLIQCLLAFIMTTAHAAATVATDSINLIDKDYARRLLFRLLKHVANAAGTNAPERALEVLSDADYRLMMDTNLNGAYYCVQAFLPGMRNRGSGTIVNIISDAGKQASPKAGPAYVMSKFGLAGLTQAINAEEPTRGVRAIGIFPGDINTPLLNRRPIVPDAAARARMMQPEDIAACVMLAVQLPSRAVIEELVIRPR